MSLLSTAPFSSVTTYRKDYYKKPCFRPAKIYPVQEYSDPLAGPLEEHLLPNFKYQKLAHPQTKYPDPKDYAEHVAEAHPTTRTFLRDPPGGPPDLDVIDELYANENATVYMSSYCVTGDFDSKIKRKRNRKTLPEGWEIPLTTHKCSYRSPAGSKLLAQTLSRIPKDNLTPNKKEREILEVKTGETIYISDISNTGEEIIKGKLHGDVNVRPKFNEDDLLRAMLIRTD